MVNQRRTYACLLALSSDNRFIIESRLFRCVYIITMLCALSYDNKYLGLTAL